MKSEVNFMSQDSKVLIDTNVLVYAADRLSDKHLIAVETLRKYFQDDSIVVSCQNLAEFTVVVTEKLKKLSKEEANQFVRGFSEQSLVLSYGVDDVLRANEIKHSYNVPFYDALLVAVMEKAKVFTIVTNNDRDFKKVNWLEVVNPFR